MQVDSYVFGALGLGPCSSVSAGGEFGPASIGMSRVDVTYSGNRIAADAQTLIFNGVTLSGAAVVITMRARSCAAPPPPPHPLRHREFRVFQLRAAPLAPHHVLQFKHSTYITHSN